MKFQTPTRPRTFDGEIEAAHELALTQREPVFVPASIYADDRGWSVMNLFQGVLTPQGQINFSLMYPGVIKAWHRHEKQTDFWLPATGQIKVGVQREEDGQTWMLVTGEKHPGITIVPPKLWHGAATVGHEPAGLFYYVTRRYDPADPDEQRRAYDSIDGFPWTVTMG